MRIPSLTFPILLVAGCAGGQGGLVVPMPDADLSSVPTNSDGIAYPTANIGGQPRTSTTPGQVFPNLTLQGIRSAATIDQPVVVSMAELYDPKGSRFDLVHVIGLFMWCPHCRKETSALMQAASFRAEHRVAAIEIAMQANSGASPGWSDLQQWVRDYGLDFPTVVDAQGAELGQHFPVNSVPLNIVVDPRTMEILSVDIGEVSDLQAYEQWFLDSRQ